MLYKFKSRSTADLIFLEPQGRRLLQIMGKDPSPSGIVTAQQIPQAIAALEAAVALEQHQQAQAKAARHAKGLDTDNNTDPSAEQVQLHQRAVPLLDMLRRSVAEDNDVVWGH